MNETFKQTVKTYPHPLFYNTTGSPTAYKLCIRHLSAAPSAGLAKLNQGYIYPKEAIHLVNLETEKIEIITDKIQLIKLRSLK